MLDRVNLDRVHKNPIPSLVSEAFFEASLEPTKDIELTSSRVRTVKRILELLKNSSSFEKEYKPFLSNVLTNAIIHGNKEIAFMIIDNSDCNLDLQDTEGKTVLMLATELDRVEILDKLIQSKRCNLELTDTEKETALFKAVLGHHRENAAQLIMAGANVNISINLPEDKHIERKLYLLDFAFNLNLHIVNLLLIHGAKIKNASQFYNELIKWNFLKPDYLSCLSFLCKQQQELRDGKSECEPLSKLSDDEFARAKEKLDSLNKIKVSDAKEVLAKLEEGTNLTKDTLTIINEYDAPFDRFDDMGKFIIRI